MFRVCENNIFFPVINIGAGANWDWLTPENYCERKVQFTVNCDAAERNADGHCVGHVRTNPELRAPNHAPCTAVGDNCYDYSGENSWRLVCTKDGSEVTKSHAKGGLIE